MRITRINHCDDTERRIGEPFADAPTAMARAVELAKLEAHRTPNNPKVDLTGLRTVSVLIGCQKVVSFRVDD